MYKSPKHNMAKLLLMYKWQSWMYSTYVIILEISAIVSELRYLNLVRLASQAASAFHMYFDL